MRMNVARNTLCAVLVGAAGISGAETADTNLPRVVWGEAAGIPLSSSADELEKILNRNSVGVVDTYSSSVPKKCFFPVRCVAGYFLGNGDATISMKDEKGKWTFAISPLDFWHGATQHSLVPISDAKLKKFREEHAEEIKKNKVDWKKYPELSSGIHKMSKGCIGKVAILIPEFEGCPDYRMATDIYRGRLVGAFKNGSKTATMTTRALRDSRTLLTVVENTGVEPITVTAQLSTGAPYYPAALSEVNTRGDIMWVKRNGKMLEVTNEVVCYGSVGVRVLGGDYKLSKEPEQYQAKTTPIKLEPGKRLTVIAEYETSTVFPPNYFLPKIQAMVKNQTDDPVTPLVKRLGKYNPVALDELTAKHTAWWREYWSRSLIDVPAEPALERHWYGKLYLLACQVSHGQFPPGLLGWVDKDKGVAWGDDYHLNWNFQQLWYGVSAANHPDMVRPYVDLLRAHMPLFKEYAAQYKPQKAKEPGVPGIVVTTATVPFGSVYGSPYNHMNLQHNNADLAMNMLTLYELTLDDALLKNQIYPYLREVALNWDGMLEADTNNNRYVINSSVGECAQYKVNPSSAIAFISRVYRSALDASQRLGLDADLRPGWEDRLTRLSRFSTCVVSNKTCLASTESTKDPFAYGGYTYLTFTPANALNMESPEAAWLNNTIDLQEVKGGCLGIDGLGWAWAAGVRSGYPINKLLEGLRRSMVRVQPNYCLTTDGSVNDMPHINGITPMFLDTVNGRIMLFPNWDMKIDARFRQLRTIGAFLVSSSVAGGVIGDVTIKSEKGLPCRIQNPWPGKALKVRAPDGTEVKLTRVKSPDGARPVNGRPPEIFEFETRAGETLFLNVDR